MKIRKKKQSHWFFLMFTCIIVACTVQPVIAPLPEATPITAEPVFTITTVPSPIPKSTETVVLASPIELRQVKLWDYYHQAAWSTDGTLLAITTTDRLELYRIPVELLWEYPVGPHDDWFEAVSISYDNSFVVSRTFKDGLILFDTATGKIIGTSGKDDCSTQTPPVRMLSTNAGFLYAGYDGNIKIAEKLPIQVIVWNLVPLQCIGKVITTSVQEGQPSMISSMSISSDENLLALTSVHNYAGVYIGLVRVWETQNYSETCEISGLYATFKPSSNVLAIVSQGGTTVSYWDVKKCEMLSSIELPSYDTEQAIAFTPDGKYLLVRRANFQVFEADIGKLVFETSIDISGGFDPIFVSPDGKYFVTSYVEDMPVTVLWEILYK